MEPEQRDDWEKLPLYYKQKYKGFKYIKPNDWFDVLEEFHDFIKYLKFDDYYGYECVTFLSHDTREKFLPMMDDKKWNNIFGDGWENLLLTDIIKYGKLADEHDGWNRLYGDNWKVIIKQYPHLKARKKKLSFVKRFLLL